MMDLSESVKIVWGRIEEIEPQHVSKIIGYLLQEYGDQHMIRLAFSPDNVIKTITYRILNTFWLTNFSMSPTLGNSPIRYCTPYQGFSNSHNYLTSNNMPVSACSDVLSNQLQRSLRIESDYLDSELYSTNYCRFPKSSPNLIQFPPKVCHYFIKGFCKHGNNCRFSHSYESNGVRNGRDDQLETDLVELLRSRKGAPISIASLPMTYYKKFHRTLQAKGYLTESQRQGRVGCSLTMLLGRLKSICLIERPDGQHYVILAQDASKYSNYASDRKESSMRQIYLTFPAESAFTEIDVSDYFNKYGAVHDVRIPSQEKRMFGFVTFVDPDTARIVLDKRNPHIICGARVLVKPYKEKPRLSARKHAEKSHRAMPYNSHHFDGETDFPFLPRASDYSRLMRQQFMDEHRSALELEQITLSESQLLPKPSARLQYFANCIDKLRLAQEFRIPEQLDFRQNNMSNGSSSEDNVRDVNTNHDGQESNQVLNLPDNPFSTAIANNGSTTT